MMKNNLTPRQIEILQLIAQGFTTKEIAVKLNLSTQTVKNNIYDQPGKAGAWKRLGAKTMCHAIALLVKDNILDTSKILPDPSIKSDSG